MIGKHIKKQIIIGTVENLNQIIAKIMNDITGVDFITVTIGSRKSAKPFLIPAATPKIKPKIHEPINPVRILKREVKTVLKKPSPDTIFENNALSVSTGPGNLNESFMIMAAINHIASHIATAKSFIQRFFICSFYHFS